MIEIAIVGGGPAGSFCAYSLAENGIYPTIFDHSHPREKPCGGLVMPDAQDLFPFLKELPIAHVERKRMCLVSPSGRQVILSSRRNKILCFSRLKFDQFLLDKALSKGAEIIKEKVTAVRRQRGLWKVKTTSQFYIARTLIGADGVNSLVRKNIIGPLRNADKGICCGYLVQGLEKEDISIRLLAHRKGYTWIIPRDDHTSLGIGSSEMSHSHEIRRELDLFIKRHCPQVKMISKWAALIPNVKDVKTLSLPVAGRDWILIGDAAGHVGTIWGDGIVYALFDGELAAQAIAENDYRLFDKLWREAYGLNFCIAVKLRKWIYIRPCLELYCKLLKFQSVL